MNITERNKYMKVVSTIQYELNQLRKKYFPNVRNLYFSNHAIQRMAERDLGKDVPFVFTVCKYFYNEVFTKVSYTSRDYRINYKGLTVGISIEPSPVSDIGRRCVLKTVFDHPTDYDVDEVITLK